MSNDKELTEQELDDLCSFIDGMESSQKKSNKNEPSDEELMALEANNSALDGIDTIERDVEKMLNELDERKSIKRQKIR